MDEIWEEIDLAESEGKLSISVPEYSLTTKDILELEAHGYTIEEARLSGEYYYVILWELV